jgi:DNA-binding response OmpR family regulator
MDSIHILLVDDEEELVTTLVERLALRGIQAEAAMAGAQALQRLEQTSYDAVVLDWKLPGMSGQEVVQKIRSLHPLMPILIMTGQVDMEAVQIEGEAQLRSDQILFKPVNINVLIDKLKVALGG